MKQTPEVSGYREGEILNRLPRNLQIKLLYLFNEADEWLPRLKRKDLWRPLVVGALALQMAACKPTVGYENPNTSSPPAITEIYQPPQPPFPTLEPTLIIELKTTAIPGSTIPGETLAIGGSQLELKTVKGEEIARLINASENGWQVVTNEQGEINFFTGYAGEPGKESQVIVLGQGPEGYQWNEENQVWQKGNQVVIPDVLLPGGWNEEKKMAGPAHEADSVFLFKDKDGNYHVGVIYSPEKVAQIPDKSNLIILSEGSGLYIGSQKNYSLQEGQQIVRDNNNNLRLLHPDGTSWLMKNSWANITSPDQLYQAGSFAGPFEEQPTLLYPSDELVQQLGVTDYQVIDNHPVALQTIIDQKSGETYFNIVAQATTDKEGKFTGWQKTIPFAIESNLVVPHPQETNPELFNLKKSDAPIPQFVKAMDVGGIKVNPQEVVDKLQYQPIKGADGKQYIIGTYHLDPNPNPNQSGETLEGPIPLVIWDEEEGWRRIGLKDLYRIGTSTIWNLLDTSKTQFNTEREKYKSIFLQNFSTYTAQVNWNNFQPNDPNSFDFSVLDWQLSQLKKLGLSDDLNLTAQSLIWQQQLPDWLKNGNYSKDQLIRFMENYIETVVRRYRGRIKEMIIVNEPAGNNLGGWIRDDFLYEKIGPNYIDIAFGAARKADPELILIFNDTDNHSPSGHTTQNTLQVVKRLKSKNLIDGVGVQMHLDGTKPFNKNQVIETLKQYGMPIYITEFDVDMSGVKGTPEERLLKQAEITRLVIQAVLESKVCVSFTMWEAPGDRFNWLENYLNKNNADGTLWTDQLDPKPSYYALIQALLEESLKSSN